jgi:5-dehydro-2-deoxygluconokinase
MTSYPKADHVYALAIDHRSQLEDIADKAGASRERIKDFKRLAVEAAAQVAKGRDGFGILLDGTYGREALFRAADHNFWISRPVELPGSRPLDFEGGGSLAAKLIEWPVNHIIKCLCFYHPDDTPEMKSRQERELLRLYEAARSLGRELLVEIICGKHGPLNEDTSAKVMQRLYSLGIKPDWWKLEPQKTARAWSNISAEIDVNDALCRGIVVLGLDAPADELAEAFRIARGATRVKGFAVGRTIFADPARAWIAGKIDDAMATQQMAERFASLVEAWEKAS